MPLPHFFEDGELIWSPDSRYVTTPDIGSTVVLDRTGKAFPVAPGSGTYRGIWSQDRPRAMIYAVPDTNYGGVYELREHRIPHGEDRLLRRIVTTAPDLQVVSGHLCFVWVEPLKPEAKGRLVQVRRLTADRVEFQLWLPLQDGPVRDPAYWDLSRLTVSPDGRFFFAHFTHSGSTMSILARTADAGAVFKRPRIASLYESDFQHNAFVGWVKLHGRWLARVANIHYGTGELIDPETGATTGLALRDVATLEFLPNGNQVSVIAPGLALSKRSDIGWDPDPETLLIALRKPSGTE